MTASLTRRLLSKVSSVCSSNGGQAGMITPRKQTDENAGDAHVEKEKTEPIVAFSRPPPLPPVLGPLVALSVLESWTKMDNSDD